MNVNALSNIASPYIQSLTNAAMSALGSFRSSLSTRGTSGTTAIPQESSPQLSPFAQLMSTLQQLQQSSPSQYSTVTQQIATNLQSASQTALANGNLYQAKELNTLSTDFTNASTNGQLPNIADLAEAMGGGHSHHSHYSQSTTPASTTSSISSTPATPSTASSTPTQPLSQVLQSQGNHPTGGHHHHHHAYAQNNASTLQADGSSTAATSSSTAGQSLSQMFGAFANNVSQGDALNPMNIIFNTLSSAGILTGN